MPAVVTITFNPCIDKNIAVDKLIPDHKLTGSAPVLHPGGGGINVARVLVRFQQEVTAIYSAGGYTGKHLREMMYNDGIPSVAVEVGSATRENIILAETFSGRQYRIGTPGTRLSDLECEAFIKEIDHIPSFGFLVVSGSFPPDIKSNIITRLALIADRRKAKFIVDTKGEPLKEALKAGVFLIKPNLGELAALTGKQFIADNEVEETAARVLATSKCEAIVVSMGERGAALITGDYATRMMPPEVKRVSTVGAGDSMVGGIITNLLQNKSLTEAVKFGVACGTAATLQPGSGLCQLQDAETIFERIITVAP